MFENLDSRGSLRSLVYLLPKDRTEFEVGDAAKGHVKVNYAFYDTETTGTDRYFDQILQFAAILTDEDLNELDRINIRCRLMPHVVPAPSALKATRITPATLADTSLPSHFEMFGEIAQRLRDWSPACFVGYNSLAFDEPLLRQAFYQAFQPIFLTNTAGNTRADIYRLVQAVSVHAQNAIVVPLDAAGNRSRRLDTIAPANGFDHRDAHEAMADVQATIFMARLIRERAPELWNSLMALTSKVPTVERALSGSVLSLTELYGKSAYIRHVIGCGQNPEYDAQVGLFDLSFDPSPIIDLSVDQLVEVMNGQPKPIRVIQANNQPILLPVEFVETDGDEAYPENDLLEQRATTIRRDAAFQDRVGRAIARRFPPREPSKYVEQQIFDGFYGWNDNALIEKFHNVEWRARPEIVAQLEDKRARELGYRIIYQERPELLRPDIRDWFEKWKVKRLMARDEDVPYRTLEIAIDEAENLSGDADGEVRQLMEEVLVWLRSRKGELNSAS